MTGARLCPEAYVLQHSLEFQAHAAICPKQCGGNRAGQEWCIHTVSVLALCSNALSMQVVL